MKEADGATDTEPYKMPSRPSDTARAAQRRKRSVLAGVTGLAILGMVAAIITAMLAPVTTPPSTFFTMRTPVPVQHNRQANAQALSLPAQLRQQAENAYLDNLISHMSLDDEIGQMIMIGFAETQMDDSLAYEIQHFHVGSAIIYAFNIQSGDQLKSLISGMQANSSVPLLIATDQEGGSVNRMSTIEGPQPSAFEVGATNDTKYARQRGVQDAQALASVGINMDLAPVVDVLNTSGGDIASRSFGTTPDRVIAMAGAYLSGLQSSGKVIGTLKHFPGLGDVPVDPHATLYTLNRSTADLERVDWAPYRALIPTGNVYAVMSTHVIVSAIDPTRPASLSEPVLTGILRNELGFNGVVVTDGIYMHALESYTLDQIAVYAVEAGNDIICSTYSIQSTAEVISAIKNAVLSGQITKARIDQSVKRILLLKMRLGLIPAPQFTPPGPTP